MSPGVRGVGCRRALGERMAVRASRGEREGSCGGCGGQTLGGKKGPLRYCRLSAASV